MVPGMASPISLSRALIVDADADTRDLYETCLVPRHYVVEHAIDGQDALARALNHPPDILVTELLLSGIAGYCLCAVLRAARDPRLARIVVLTAEARPATLERARRAGADVVLTKPCLPDVLLMQMERAAAASQSRREAQHGWHVDRGVKPAAFYCT